MAHDEKFERGEPGATEFRRDARGGHAVFVRRRRLEAWTLGLSLTLPAVVAAIALGMVLRYQRVGGWVVPIIALGAVIWGGVAGARYLARRGLGYAQFLRHLEQRLRLGQNELVNADELEARLPAMADPLARGLAQQVVTRGSEALRRVEVGKLAPATSLRNPLWRAASAIAAAALLFILSPDGFRSSSARLVQPGRTELPPALLIKVLPGDATIERGTTVAVSATLPKERGEAKLFYRNPGGAWRALGMEPGSGADGSASFQGRLVEVGETTEYAVSSGDARSEVYRLSVIDPLRALGYQKRIEPPAYTRLAPEQEVAADGSMTALIGSRLSLGVEASLPQASGRLVFDDGQSLALEAATPGHLSAAFPLRHSGDYHVELTAENIGATWKSETFHLDAVADRPPTLYQLAPERSIQLPAEMAVTIEADCLDDFGLSRLDLVYQRNDSAPERRNLARWQGSREERVSAPWELETILRTPGDQVRYHLELVDNDPISGPKTTLGPECEIHFPSLEEMYASVDDDREQQQQSATEMLNQQKDLRQELEKARMELKQSKQVGWQQQEELKQLAQRQAEVTDQLDKLAQSLDQSLAKMQQTNSFSPEMMQKVQEIGELVRQINDPSFQQQMDRLQQAMQKLDRSAIDKALEQMQQNQQQLEKSLDRTLELLKQLVAEEKLDQLLQQAEKLLAEQKDINQQLAGNDPPDTTGTPQDPKDANDAKQQDSSQKDQSKSGDQQQDQKNAQNPDEQPKGDQASKQNQMSKQEAEALKKKQEELAKELAKLQEQMEKLRQEEEKRLRELQATQESKPEQQLNQASQKMQQASQSMSQCNKSGSLKFGRQAEKKLENFAKQMRDAQASAKSKQNEEIVKRLFALSNQLVSLSKAQESLLSSSPSRPTRELAAEQSRLADGAKRTLDELYEVARMSRLLSPELGRTMGEAARELETAALALEQGDRPSAMNDGRASANALNQTVLALLNASNQQQSSCSSGSCSNPMSALRGLSGQQQSLNQDTQQMMGGQSGQRLSPEGGMGDALAQMAARQEMIRKGLQEVQNSLGNRSDVLGRLDDLGKEMDEIAQEMRSHNVDQRVLRRQEKILSRLLTAQRSLRKEDYKDERVSRTGQNPEDRPSPGAVANALTRQDLLRRGILRGSQDPVPTDYRTLVEQYFRALSEKP